MAEKKMYDDLPGRFPSNSNAVKEQTEKTLENAESKKTVTGKVTVKEPSNAKKLARSFIAEDLSTVANSVWKETIVPTVKKLIWEGFSNALGMTLGIDIPKRRLSGSENDYHGYYRSKADERKPVRYEPREYFNLDDVEFDYKSDAVNTINELEDIIREYGKAKVSDFYEKIGKTAPSTAFNYGWYSLEAARVIQNYNGTWSIEFPKIKPIE